MIFLDYAKPDLIKLPWTSVRRYSQKTDVFSFGVVLAQVVTAREPTDTFFVENGGNIGNWINKCLATGNGEEAIDPSLRGSGFEAEILLAMRVAIFCTKEDPLERPKSSEVLKMLLQIRNPHPTDVTTISNSPDQPGVSETQTASALLVNPGPPVPSHPQHLEDSSLSSYDV